MPVRQRWLVADTLRAAWVVTIVNAAAAVLLWGWMFAKATEPIPWWWAWALLATAFSVVAVLGWRTVAVLHRAPRSG